MSIKKNIVYNTILTVSNVAFPIVTTPYVSRILGVENVGVANFATTFATYFVLFASLGIPLYGIREIAKQNNDQEALSKSFSEIFVINCCSTVFFLLLFICTIFFVEALFDKKEYLFTAGILLLFAPLNLDWFFSGREQFRMVTIRSIIAKFISFFGLFLFVSRKDDIIPYLLLSALSVLISQIYNFNHIVRKEVTLSLVNLELRKHLKPILILFLSSVAISIYTMLGPLLLGFLSDYVQVGYYTSAIKVSKMILPFVTTMSLVVVARINALKGSDDYLQQTSKLLVSSFDYMMMMAVPATIGLIVIAPRFVPLFFGSSFLPSTLSLQVLSLLIIIIGMSNLFGTQVLVAMGKEKKFFKAILSGTISNIILNLLLIDKYGALGASIASVVAETLVTITTCLFAIKVIPININFKSIWQPILGSTFILPISAFFDKQIDNDLVYILLTGLTCIIVYTFVLYYVFKHHQAEKIVNLITAKVKRIV